MIYIHELEQWPHFKWDEPRLSKQLTTVHRRQARLIGRMESLGFSLRGEAQLQTLTEEVIKTSEIEGEKLDRTQVRSSLARRLGMDAGGLTRADRNVEGIVDMMIDATQNFSTPLTDERLFGWQSALFPTGRSGLTKIRTGEWRKEIDGPMEVVSGPTGRPKVHFEAPEANRLDQEMKAFLAWFNGKPTIDPILKTAIAHLWFVTIHPFTDGNGRIARAIADMALARSEDCTQRFYSMSVQIAKERKTYYDILEATQRGPIDVTPWLEWFLACLARAFEGAETTLATVLEKANFWNLHAGVVLNDRQKAMLNRLLDGFEGNVTSSKWATISKCSQDSASRDIDELVKRGMLIKNPGGGRSTSYSFNGISSIECVSCGDVFSSKLMNDEMLRCPTCGKDQASLG